MSDRCCQRGNLRAKGVCLPPFMTIDQVKMRCFSAGREKPRWRPMMPAGDCGFPSCACIFCCPVCHWMRRNKQNSDSCLLLRDQCSSCLCFFCTYWSNVDWLVPAVWCWMWVVYVHVYVGDAVINYSIDGCDEFTAPTARHSCLNNQNYTNNVYLTCKTI